MTSDDGETWPLRPDPSWATGCDEQWADVAEGLARGLGKLEDLDFVSFWHEEVMILSVSRVGMDEWILAIGPDDPAEPIELSSAQRATLLSIGIHPPLGDRVPIAAQRRTWWFRLNLPAYPPHFRSAGLKLVAAARHVYGVNRPTDMAWAGVGLSEAAKMMLNALPLSRGTADPG